MRPAHAPGEASRGPALLTPGSHLLTLSQQQQDTNSSSCWESGQHALPLGFSLTVYLLAATLGRSGDGPVCFSTARATVGCSPRVGGDAGRGGSSALGTEPGHEATDVPQH